VPKPVVKTRNFEEGYGWRIEAGFEDLVDHIIFYVPGVTQQEALEKAKKMTIVYHQESELVVNICQDDEFGIIGFEFEFYYSNPSPNEDIFCTALVAHDDFSAACDWLVKAVCDMSKAKYVKAEE